MLCVLDHLAYAGVKLLTNGIQGIQDAVKAARESNTPLTFELREPSPREDVVS